ncbi:hypothetical protein DPMN_072262 [Dreissena polymorpha]|uniref:Uncharacterized protein n=1 Tax=Dreissena polymorpha TaxID=45954 RepID=A0A9D3Z872_DREPO|nr:hypothetical protein DPMN_072262 [Dreissena polymorpha]
MRRSKRVRQPSKRMLLYSQDTDSDSTTITKGTLERHSSSDDEPVLAFVPSSSDESEGEPLSEIEDD